MLLKTESSAAEPALRARNFEPRLVGIGEGVDRIAAHHYITYKF